MECYHNPETVAQMNTQGGGIHQRKEVDLTVMQTELSGTSGPGAKPLYEALNQEVWFLFQHLHLFTLRHWVHCKDPYFPARK